MFMFDSQTCEDFLCYGLNIYIHCMRDDKEKEK